MKSYAQELPDVAPTRSIQRYPQLSQTVDWFQERPTSSCSTSHDVGCHDVSSGTGFSWCLLRKDFLLPGGLQQCIERAHDGGGRLFLRDIGANRCPPPLCLQKGSRRWLLRCLHKELMPGRIFGRLD
ncbi:hypothetical protein BC936DRAFT_144042 [Jimgerdemannia flammicorona]|uniref:Uncharacterized protein n=1 Tax=Jimgerdemannia flammicorona TaxID=994334 RepID=A0A433DP11_9FUNG|nr:hypothetical protein BC936DRAFT_144042 [Jimgerdemannia flammicorona]